jgi:hypothetical protein
MVTETQFNSVQPLSFTFSSINNGNTMARLAKARKAARPSSSALNSVDPITFKSTSESPFAFGQVSSFSAANPFTFIRHEVDKVSDHGEVIFWLVISLSTERIVLYNIKIWFTFSD